MSGTPRARSYRAWLPLPPAGLGPNARLHRFARSRLIKAAREAGLLAGRDAMRGEFGPFPVRGACEIVFEFRLGTRHRRDLDNLVGGMKAYLDGLVDSGLLADDSEATRLVASKRLVARADVGVLVTISAGGAA
jgi:hypothetical protein